MVVTYVISLTPELDKDIWFSPLPRDLLGENVDLISTIYSSSSVKTGQSNTGFCCESLVELPLDYRSTMPKRNAKPAKTSLASRRLRLTIHAG